MGSIVSYLILYKMVKNTHGGNKSKGFARKNTTKRDTMLRTASEEGEIYAQAVKVMGGSIASAIDLTGQPLRVHIRGKFRGRGKRDNFISPGTWLLVGLHSWGDKEDAVRDCDVLEVYSDIDKQRLMTSVTSVNWGLFTANDMQTAEVEDDKEARFTFADDTMQEYESLIASNMSASKSKKEPPAPLIEEDEEINVDDI